MGGKGYRPSDADPAEVEAAKQMLMSKHRLRAIGVTPHQGPVNLVTCQEDSWSKSLIHYPSGRETAQASARLAVVRSERC